MFIWVCWSWSVIDLSTAHPPVLVFMIYASLAWILIIIWKPYRSIIILLTNYRTRWWWYRIAYRHDWQVNTIDGPSKLVRQDAILGGLSIGQLYMGGNNVVLFCKSHNQFKTGQPSYDICRYLPHWNLPGDTCHMHWARTHTTQTWRRQNTWSTFGARTSDPPHRTSCNIAQQIKPGLTTSWLKKVAL